MPDPRTEEIQDALLAHLRARHCADPDFILDPETPLVESGILDSLGFVEFVGFIQSSYTVELGDDDYTPENFATIERCAQFVHERSVSHES